GALGPVIDFEPSPLTFAGPATVSIPVALASGFDPSRVGVMAVEPDGTSRDITAVTVAGNLATFEVSSFSHYGCHDEGDHHHQDGGGTPSCHDSHLCGAADG